MNTLEYECERSHKMQVPYRDSALANFGRGFTGVAAFSTNRRGGNQVSNESLILAQNQRWRRA